MKSINTPYGKKTPELLCKAMDALVLQDEVLRVLELVKNTSDYQWVTGGNNVHFEVEYIINRIKNSSGD